MDDVKVTWSGRNGTPFVLHGPGARGQGVWIESVGEGMYFPPMQIRKQQTARGYGARLGSMQYDPRIIDLHGYCMPIEGKSLENVENDWWGAWDSLTEGKLVVQSATGTRWIYLRLEREPKVTVSRNPHHRGILEWDITAIAADPFFTSGTDVFTASNQKFSVLRNSGDVPSWPRFVASSGGTFKFPDGDGVAKVAVTDIGEGFRVDSDPLHETVTLTQSGVSGWKYLDGSDYFANPISPLTTLKNVPVTYPSGVTVTAEVDIKWHRPW